MSGLSLQDLPSAPPTRSGRRSQERRRSQRRRRRLRTLAVLLVCLLVVGGGTYLASAQLRDVVAQLTEPDDYEGAGTEAVRVQVTAGASGRTIGRVLEEAGVVKTAGAFVEAAADEPRAATIQPGTYELRRQMSARDAMALLLDPASRQSFRVTVPEGFTAARTYERLAEATGIPVADYEAAAADPALGLPPEAGGVVEGHLFPATYDYDLDVSALEVLQSMVARSREALDSLGVPADQRHGVLTRASLVQAEASTTDDMGRVARVLENRLADGTPLQLDTTVNYANGKSGITTTAQDRANPSPYNTYLHSGLPPGPINNPGEAALRAVLSPTPGDWRYFVVVDPDTGETLFAVTGEEHQRNVRQFQQWLRENPQG
ncbi:endolytic transglycosylase MltG [Quadrisphaera sp. DSM 44207]|uniref:endolytic transglycosylase MltG n=1 Tax=Quadrisphaera sp. DSM 44207 TaxID=1881057 RepID=UPI000881F915|nr:endolytic transglycosylase MltG [Quadrisphaera sp. DSM 44207]SDQ46980.1 UPF0755 protein [Quadrisphaera sp. DSM 44207]